MKIGIFCSANDQIAAEYFEQTEKLVAWCAKNGHSIVFGGCDKGLMGCIARSFAKNAMKSGKNGDQSAKKADLIGVVPRIIEQGGQTATELTQLIPSENLSDRKDLLLAESDVLVALPGGIGTLDEVFTVAAGHTIGYHRKKIVLYNIGGFWDALIRLLDDLQARGMIRGHWSDFIKVAASLDELTEQLVGLVPEFHLA